jgi:outer membrane receptor for ferrienterochelin and colicins
MNATRTMLSLALLAATCVSSVAVSQEADDLASLLDTKVVSSASRTAERAGDAPAIVTTVTADELKRYGLRTVADAINFLSVGMFTQDNLHGSAEVGSRGVLLSPEEGTHVLVVIDGHVINDPWSGVISVDHGIGVPMELIDHIEIMTGPGSVLYGADAMLGVISITTKRAKDINGLTATAEGQLTPALTHNADPTFGQGMGGTGRLSAVFGHELRIAGIPLEVVGGLEYYGQAGEHIGWTLQPGHFDTDGVRVWPYNYGPQAQVGSWGGTSTSASYWQQTVSGILKLDYGEVELWARAALDRHGSPADEGIGVLNDFNASVPGTSQQSFNFELKWHHSLSNRVSILARTYLNFLTERIGFESSSLTAFGLQGFAPPDEDLSNFTFDVAAHANVTWGGAELQSTVDWLGDGRFPLLAGVEVRETDFAFSEDVADIDGSPLIPNLSPYHHSRWLVAPYLQQRATLLKSLRANVGVRVDAAENFGAHLSPRAALIWSAPGGGDVKASYSSAFRTPTGSEEFQFPTQAPLRPETISTGELTYTHRVGRHQLTLGGFYSHYSDLIEFALMPGPTPTVLYLNTGRINNYGGEVAVEGVFGALRYKASLTLDQNQASGTQLTVNPGWFGNATLAYEFGNDRPTVSLGAFLVGPRLVNNTYATGYGAGGAPLTWAGGTTAPPEVDLRATVTVPLWAGFDFHGTVGASLTRWAAYTAGPSTAPIAPGQAPYLQPNADRLFVMGTLSWHTDIAGH